MTDADPQAVEDAWDALHLAIFNLTALGEFDPTKLTPIIGQTWAYYPPSEQDPHGRVGPRQKNPTS